MNIINFFFFGIAFSNSCCYSDNGDLSPNTVDNESCKSNDNEPEYPRQRRNSSMKVSPYSEEGKV